MKLNANKTPLLSHKKELKSGSRSEAKWGQNNNQSCKMLAHFVSFFHNTRSADTSMQLGETRGIDDFDSPFLALMNSPHQFSRKREMKYLMKPQVKKSVKRTICI